MKTFFQQFFGSLTVVGLVIGMPYLLGILPTIIDNKLILAPIIFLSGLLTVGLLFFIFVEEYAHPIVFYLSAGTVALVYTFYSLYHP
jgi:hypothetical protein